MIRSMVYNHDSGRVHTGDEQLLNAWKTGEQAGWLWVDLDGEDPSREAELLSRDFSFSSLVIADAQRDRHPPKLEAFDDYFFVLLKGLDADTWTIEFKTIQIAFFVGDQFLVTLRKNRSVSIDTIWESVLEDNKRLEKGPAHIVLTRS